MKKRIRTLALLLAVTVTTTMMPAQALPVFAAENTELQEGIQSRSTYRLEAKQSSFSIFEEEKVKLEAVAKTYEGDTLPELRYEWKKYQINEYGWNELVTIEGATSNTLEVDGSEAGTYYCYAYAEDDNTYHTPATFNINIKSNVILKSKKTYYNIAYGDAANLKVEASTHKDGTSIVSYKWYKGNNTRIKGATSDSCKVTASEASQNYYCIVEDSEGNTNTISFVVSANAGLKIKDTWKNYATTEGGSVTMSVDATTKYENTTVEYQWKKYDSKKKIYKTISGATAAAYTASDLKSGDMFQCVVTATYNDFVQEETVDVNISVSKHGVNLSYLPSFVKTGTTVNFNASSVDGTLKVKYYDSEGDTHTLTGNNGQYSIIPDAKGYYRITAYVDNDGVREDESYGEFYAFSEAKALSSGQKYTLKKDKTNNYGDTIPTIYSFVPEQTGTYAIVSNKYIEAIICEEGSTDSYWYDLESDGEGNYETTATLEMGKTYYIRNNYHGEDDTYDFTIVNEVFCDHVNTKVLNAKAATCTEAGYTGDIICKDCDNTITIGTVIPATGHTVTVVNAKAATCTEAGYTGDKVCSVCNAVVEAGVAIPATGHTETVVNAKAATMSADGYTGDKVCTVCNTTVEAGTAIAKIKSVTLKKTTLTYTGKNQKPVVVVKDRTGKTIPAANYTVTYSKDSKTVGVKTAKVTFKGNYSGTKKLTYTIVPKNATKLTVKAATKSINVSWKKQATQTTGYKIQYSTKKNFAGAKTITVKKNSTTKTTIKSLKKGTTYYVRICTYKTVNKKNICSAWSSAKKIKVTK